MVNTTVVLKDDFYTKVRRYCEEEGYSYNKLMNKLLRDRLNDK